MKNYIKEAMRTNSNTVGTYNVHPDLIHGALGLADELVEYFEAEDVTNAIEELGDICWFVALMADRIGVDVFDDIQQSSGHPRNDLRYMIGETVSLIKRAYAYGKKCKNDDIEFCLRAVVDNVSALCEYHNTSLDKVMHININKLAARFPDKFTPEKALVRDLDKERAVLEGK